MAKRKTIGEDDIFPFESASNFWDRTKYWGQVDIALDKYKKDLEASSTAQEGVDTRIGEEQSAIISRWNEESKTNIEQYKRDIDKEATRSAWNIAKRREQAKGLVDRQEEAAWLEANIAAAKAWVGWRMSVSQITSINKDITNQFAVSINNAIKDNINFQWELDTKLSELWFSVIDKKKVLDEFKKTLTDEEVAPLLDAIVSKYKTRKDFMIALSDTIKWLNQAVIDNSRDSMLRSERLLRDEEAFNAMNAEERAREIIDRFWPTWNVLLPGQQQQYINDTVSWKQSFRETLNIIKNLKDQTEQQKLLTQQGIASWDIDTDYKKGLIEFTWIDPTKRVSTTEQWRVYTGKDIVTPIQASQNKITDKKQSLSWKTFQDQKQKEEVEPKSYKKGKLTYRSKADYDMLNRAIFTSDWKLHPTLEAMKNNNPTKYKRTLKAIKNKYTI